MKCHLYEYIVEGCHFPLDMLRYDSCWPASQEDVNHLIDDMRREGVRPTRWAIRMASHTSPTIARWASFGWMVYGVKKDRRRVV